MSTQQAVVVTGYPLSAVVYPVPPHPHQHINLNPNPPQHPRAALFLLTLTAIISVLFFLVTMLVIVWLIIHPYPPKFRVDSLLISGFNATSSQISGNWTAHLTVFNPNTRMQAFYEVLEGYVYYNDEPLAQNRIPPLDQDTLSVTGLSITMVATAADVEDWVVPAVNFDRSRGSVKFGVRIAAVVRFRSRSWKTRRLVKIHCNNLAVAMPGKATGSILQCGGEQNCNVYM